MKTEALTVDDVPITVEEAVSQHQKGDRYIDPATGKWLQLHIGREMRSHFEFMRNQHQEAQRRLKLEVK